MDKTKEMGPFQILHVFSIIHPILNCEKCFWGNEAIVLLRISFINCYFCSYYFSISFYWLNISPSKILKTFYTHSRRTHYENNKLDSSISIFYYFSYFGYSWRSILCCTIYFWSSN